MDMKRAVLEQVKATVNSSQFTSVKEAVAQWNAPGEWKWRSGQKETLLVQLLHLVGSRDLI